MLITTKSLNNMRCEDYVMQEIYVDHTLIKDEDLGSRNGFD